MYSSPEETPVDRGVSEASSEDLRSTRALVNHPWTLEEKIIVCLLARWFLNDWTEKTLLFNAYFRAPEASQNCGRPMSKPALRSMWGHLQNGRSAKGAWKTIWHDTAFSTTSNAWAAARASLEGIASEMGIIITRRTLSNGLDLAASPTPRRIVKRKRGSDRPENISPETEDDMRLISLGQRLIDDESQMPTKSGHRRRADLVTPPPSCHASKRLTGRHKPGTPRSVGIRETGFLTPISTSRVRQANLQPYRLRNVPCIAFRAYNSYSRGVNSPTGFLAGEFIEHAQIPFPVNRESKSYRSDARRHIGRVATGSTPFISVTKNLLRVLQYAVKMTQPAYIAVIDLHQAGQIGQSELEGPHARVQSVESLDLKSLDGYYGKGEWIIWGAISADAIISVHSLVEFLPALPSLPGSNGPFYAEHIRSARWTSEARSRIKKAKTPLNQSTGQAVGQLLGMLRIPTRYLEDATYSIISDWKFCGWQRSVWRRNEDFMHGVYEGFRGDLVEVSELGNHDMEHSSRVSQYSLSTSDSDEETWNEDACDDGKVFEDSERQPENEAMDSMPNHGPPEEDIVSKGRISTNRVGNDEQVTMDLKDNMSQPTWDEVLWAHAFRDDLDFYGERSSHYR